MLAECLKKGCNHKNCNLFYDAELMECHCPFAALGCGGEKSIHVFLIFELTGIAGSVGASPPWLDAYEWCVNLFVGCPYSECWASAGEGEYRCIVAVAHHYFLGAYLLEYYGIIPESVVSDYQSVSLERDVARSYTTF